ncbi:MAG: GNAT family N-acetyltransferase [Terriglobia bacterium]
MDLRKVYEELLNHMIPQMRTMTPADVPAGMRLKDMAGWNQTKDDWERFLRANPEGCFVAEWNKQVAGTVTTIVYEDRFAWIGMVLVDAQLRGKGIGTALLLKAIDHLDAKKIPCVKLDATPEGKPIYARLGFRGEYEIERHRLTRETKPKASAGADRDSSENIETILEMDREVFGADRSALLRSVARGAAELVITSRVGDTLNGFGLGREGSRADHLGPWVASTALAAREVLEGFLRRSRREVAFVDVVKDNPWAPALLAEKEFQFSRGLTRMYRGENTHPGRPDLLCAILGPEFG